MTVPMATVMGIVQQCVRSGVTVEPQVASFIYERLQSSNPVADTVAILTNAESARRETFRLQEAYASAVVAFDNAQMAKQKDQDALKRQVGVQKSMNALETFVGVDNAHVLGDAASLFKNPASEANAEEVKNTCLGLRALENSLAVDELIASFRGAYENVVSEIDQRMFDLQRQVSNYETVLAAPRSSSVAGDATWETRVREEFYLRVQLLVYLRDAKSMAEAAWEDMQVGRGIFENAVQMLTPDAPRQAFSDAGKRFADLLVVAPNVQKAAAILAAVRTTNVAETSLSSSLVEQAHAALKSNPKDRTSRMSVAVSSSSTDAASRQAELTQFTGRNVQLNGFDAVELVDMDGILVSGAPEFCVKYADSQFLFSSQMNAQQFIRAPAAYLDAVLAQAFRGPELIVLLGLTSLVPLDLVVDAASNVTASPGERGKKVMCDMGTETPVHFIERHIDPKYTFSEWELRRRALQLADLRNKRTHSTQTNKSHFRRENESQVYLPKPATTQTGKERGVQPRKNVRYIQGLRGDKEQKMNVVNLQIDL